MANERLKAKKPAEQPLVRIQASGIKFTEILVSQIHDNLTVMSDDRQTMERVFILEGGQDAVDEFTELVIPLNPGYRVYYDIYTQFDGGCYEDTDDGTE